ncbi:hypothetical protein DRO03_11760 [Methanosarcinales archaeon]|nr:MAG: hypothetical protein DRO03_11760 [Methanosarcinales archaeon]
MGQHLRPNKKEAKYGFPSRFGENYAKIAVKQGMPVVIVRETERYIGKVKERLPVMRIMAKTA